MINLGDDIIKEKYIIISCGIIFILVLVILSIVNLKTPFEELKYKINNKESFVVIVYDNEHFTDGTKKLFDYYSETYNFSYLFISKDKLSKKNMKEFIKMIDLDEKTFIVPYYIYIENGKFKGGINNASDENELKYFLLKYKIISSVVPDKDYLLNDDEFDEFINNEEGKILLYTWNDNTLYSYRTKLKDYQISYIYAERLNNQLSEDKVKDMINWDHTKDIELPILIKFKSGKVIGIKKNITVNNVVSKYEELSQS